MFTSLVFIISLILLLRCFKSRRSRIIIGVLYSLFVVWYVQAILNYGKYTLQPGQSISLTVNPRIQDVEYYSELILKKTDKNKLELNGREYWSVSGSELHYDLSKQNVFKWVRDESGELTESYVENSDLADIYIEKSNLIILFKVLLASTFMIAVICLSKKYLSSFGNLSIFIYIINAGVSYVLAIFLLGVNEVKDLFKLFLKVFKLKR
mgnify:CR=1 FL=1